MATFNRQITLASRPVGLPRISDFHLAYSPLPSPGDGKVLVRTTYLSLDPYMRGRMDEGESYAPPVALGGVMTGGAVGFVLESRDPRFRVGDAVEGHLGWQEYAVLPAGALRRVDISGVPISAALGVLGMPGLTAYFGLLEICEPRQGETVLVSSAAGAVGMIVGQLAKLRGCRVVGVAGSEAKISWLLDELGFDAALNYKSSGEFAADLQAQCPQGVDVYFDNVGGETTDAVMLLLNTGARVSVCGQISQYNLETPEMGPRWLGQLVVKQALVQGFLVSSFAERFPEGLAALERWLRQGSLKYREDVAQGIEAAPQAFIGMLQGKNQGKQLVQLSDL